MVELIGCKYVAKISIYLIVINIEFIDDEIKVLLVAIL